MSRRALVALCGVTALAVGGCAGDEISSTGAPIPGTIGTTAQPVMPTRHPASPTPRPTTAPRSVSTPSPTAPSPTPARLTTAQASTRYLAITRPYNVALERFEQAANRGDQLSSLRRRATLVATANLAESRRLSAVAWPSVVAADIRKLVTANAAARTHWRKAAAAGSLTAMAGHLRRASAAGGKAPAAEIRRALGLPKYDEKDYD